jgi:choline dehydrogenase-like flavoprotein
MKPIVVVGSGASAVHFALTVLQKGRDVLMLDVGRTRPASVMPEASWAQLKATLSDPVGYFLGERFEAVLFPGGRREYYGFPPSKNYVFSDLPQFRHASAGFEPLVSFAQGGLAEAWTGGVYPFNEAELSDFPFSQSDLSSYYDLVADRIGISGTVDDLARFMPVHQHLLPPLELDEHSSVLADAYLRRRSIINDRLGCYIGRSRIATISRDRHARRACSNLGRCLWGCPSGSLYTPSMTLEDCRRFPGFRYASGVFVRRFLLDGQRRIKAVFVEDLASGRREEVEAETLVLAAGALATTRIFLESVYHATGETVTLGGLMDNRQILVPFVNLSMLRRPYNPDSYQYHQLGLGIEGATPREYIHGQITTLKTALIHPIVQKLPLDLRTSLAIFRNVHAALGVVNINLHDTRRGENTITFDPGTKTEANLRMHYQPAAGEAKRMRSAIKQVRRVLRALNCLVPPGMTHVRPMGGSVHYAGLLPMSTTKAPWTTSAYGQSHDFDNLFIADGTTFPFLSAKNLTFTLMANASRIADCAF